ncbi:hypothetical protein ATO13_08261 [Stappia sp. 22II-S9-Z10]|nr:hypothetical protein ATO13_08261 [Stappia sp. 22II-S9-Z10]
MIMGKSRTSPAPEILNLVDEFGALESRVRFYCHAAERLACEALSCRDADPLIRGGDDLSDFLKKFKEQLNDFAIAEMETGR